VGCSATGRLVVEFMIFPKMGWQEISQKLPTTTFSVLRYQK
jgi:hypothetical protein